jgi:hypothetical protein
MSVEVEQVEPVPVVVPCGPDATVGVFVVGAGRTAFRPAVDVQRLARYGVVATALVAAAAVGVAALRRPPAIGSVRMGHGGWISVKGAPLPALRSAAPRPWWARLLRARELAVR